MPSIPSVYIYLSPVLFYLRSLIYNHHITAIPFVPLLSNFVPIPHGATSNNCRYICFRDFSL